MNMAAKPTSECKSKVKEFLFKEVCQHLTPTDVKHLAYSQDLPGRYVYTNDGIDVIFKLEMEGKFSKRDLSPLAQMMRVIGRKDLAKKIRKYAKKQKNAKDSPELQMLEINLAERLKIAKAQTKIHWEELQAEAKKLGCRIIEDNIAGLLAIIEQPFQQKRSLATRLGSSSSSDGDTPDSPRSSSSSSDDGQEARPPVATPFQTCPQFDVLKEVKMSKFVHVVQVVQCLIMYGS